jgi:hypothetical protein
MSRRIGRPPKMSRLAELRGAAIDDFPPDFWRRAVFPRLHPMVQLLLEQPAG